MEGGFLRSSLEYICNVGFLVSSPYNTLEIHHYQSELISLLVGYTLIASGKCRSVVQGCPECSMSTKGGFGPCGPPGPLRFHLIHTLFKCYRKCGPGWISVDQKEEGDPNPPWSTRTHFYILQMRYGLKRSPWAFYRFPVRWRDYPPAVSTGANELYCLSSSIKVHSSGLRLCCRDLSPPLSSAMTATLGFLT